MIGALASFALIGVRKALARVLGTYERGVAPMAGKQ